MCSKGHSNLKLVGHVYSAFSSVNIASRSERIKALNSANDKSTKFGFVSSNVFKLFLNVE